jgi:hypothetical protein
MLRQEDCEFQASLGYIYNETLSQKQPKKQVSLFPISRGKE